MNEEITPGENKKPSCLNVYLSFECQTLGIYQQGVVKKCPMCADKFLFFSDRNIENFLTGSFLYNVKLCDQFFISSYPQDINKKQPSNHC